MSALSGQGTLNDRRVIGLCVAYPLAYEKRREGIDSCCHFPYPPLAGSSMTTSLIFLGALRG